MWRLLRQWTSRAASDTVPAELEQRRVRREPAAPESISPPSQFCEPERDHQRELSRDAGAWLRRLPPDVVPAQLAAKYPRIVNRIAICWGDPALMARLFDQLLIDDRGNRAGFPRPIVAEMIRLRMYHSNHINASAPAPLWDAAEPQADRLASPTSRF